MRQQLAPLFWSQLLSLLQAHLPLADALALLSEVNQRDPLAQLAQQLLQALHQGHRFSDALRSQPTIFEAWHCDLIETATQIDRLVPICALLVDQYQQQQYWREQVHKVLRYPVLVGCAAIAMSAYLLSNVVPQFATLFSQQQATLPAYTRWLLHVSQLPWLGISASLSIILILITGIAKRHPNQAANFCWHCPILRRYHQQAALILWLQTLAMLIDADIPLLPALRTLSQLVKAPALKQGFARVSHHLLNGEPLHQALKVLPALPPLIRNWLSLAQRSHCLQSTLIEMAAQQQTQLSAALDQAISWIEPMMMLSIGTLVAGILLALYLPIMQIGAIF